MQKWTVIEYDLSCGMKCSLIDIKYDCSFSTARNPLSLRAYFEESQIF